MWYNYIVKRLAFISTAFLLAAASFGGISASAAAEDTRYPDNSDFVFNLSFSELKDYAVGENAFAFIDGNEIKVYEIGTLDEDSDAPVYKNGNLTEYKDFSVTLTAIDCKDGVFYYSDGNGTVYSLPDGEICENITVTPAEDEIYYKGYTYTILEDRIQIYNATAETNITDVDGVFSYLKKYGESVYAVSNNALYEFNGFESKILEMQHVDFSPALSVSVGNASQTLKDYTLTFVTVDSGSFMTEVDLSAPLYGYFDAGETSAAEEDTAALLLGYSGNAAIISIGNKSYITLKTNVTESVDNSEYFTEAEFTKAQLLGDAIYASPFVMECVYALYPATGAIVSVTGKLHNDVLEADFYEVEYSYEYNGQTLTVKGYVIDGLLTGDNVNDNAEPDEHPDEDYTEKNNVRTVLIVLMVVILVLIALSYLTWVGLSDKRLKGKNKKSGEEK